MIPAASVIPPPARRTGATSFVEGLFGSIGYMATIVPPSGSEVKCQHCSRVAFSVVGECLVVTHRHGGDWHKTVVALADLGLERTDVQE